MVEPVAPRSFDCLPIERKAPQKKAVFSLIGRLKCERRKGEGATLETARALKHLTIVVGLTFGASNAANALEMEYITFNGFTQVVTAFRYIGLFFSNSDYGSLVYIAAVVGFAAAAVMASVKGYREEGTFKNWLFMFGIGVGIYTAFITPKGTIHVYDRTLNAYEPVTGVPDGIVLLAGLTNLAEQVAVDIANASSPTPYENTAGGIVFQLVRNTYLADQPLDDEYLWENIKNYYLECGQIAAALPGSGFDLNAVNRTSTDLLATFANAKSNAVEFPYRSETDPQGTLTTCTDAYANIQTALTDPGTYSSLVTSLCGSVGFDTSNAAQAAQCNMVLDQIVPTVFGQAGDRLVYLRSAALALAMQDAAADENPERAIAQEANRAAVTQGLGLLSFAQEYGQSIRAGFLAASLATLPITMLFLVTPLRWRALSLSVGFFVFVSIWGITDIGLQVMIESVTRDAFEEVRRNNLAFNAFILAPPASVKALTVFGSSRLISISLASIAVVAIFRFSGASFAQLTGSFARQGEAIGSEAAESRLNPTRLAGDTQSRAQAAGALSGLGATGSSGFSGIAQQSTGQWLQNLSRHRAFSGAGADAGVSGADIYRFAGATAGGEAAGRVSGLGERTGFSEAGLATGAHDAAATGTERGFLDAQTFETGAQTLASDLGVDTGTAKELIAGYGNQLAAGRVAGTGGDLSRTFGAARQEERQHLGGAEGIRDAATKAGLSPEQISRAGSFLDTLYSSGDTQFAGNASEGDFDNLTLGGELRRERASGEAAGVRDASAYTGKSPQDLSLQAARIDAGGRLIENERLANFADAHSISVSDIQNARGANLETAVNDRTLEAFGRYLSPDQTDIARPGSSLAFTYDPLTNEVGRVDVRSGLSGSQDDSVHVSDGLRVDARQGTEGGQTIFRYADLAEAGNNSGTASFGRLLEKHQQEGSTETFLDSVAQQSSNYLSGIAGKQVSYFSSDSHTGSSEIYAGTKIGGGFKFFGLVDVSGEAGAKGLQAWSDIDATQSVNSYDYWNDEVRDVWDETIGNKNFEGDRVDQVGAFLTGVSDLRGQAHDIKEWVKEQGADDHQVSGQKAAEQVEEKPSDPTATPKGYYDSRWSGYRRH